MLDFLAEFFWYFGDFLVIALFHGLSRRWNRKQEWFGVVLENKRRRRRSWEKYRYLVVFRKDNGRRKRLRMDQWQASFYKSGWRYHKKKGEDLPDYNSGMEYFG